MARSSNKTTFQNPKAGATEGEDSPVLAALEYLRSPEAVRERSENVFEAGLYGELEHLSVHLEKLPQAAHRVVEVTRKTYPDLNIPYHGRFRHFGAGGIDRLGELDERLGAVSADERARIHFDLVVPSVLLDAGAGDRWRFKEPGTGVELGHSEGLAVASFHLFASGALADDPDAPFKATASGLRAIDAETLGRAFQVGDDNPLIGLEGRAALLRSLAAALGRHPSMFGEPPRVGNLFDFLKKGAGKGGVAASSILRAVLDGFSSVWPSRLTLGSEPLGDVGRHRRAGGEGPSAGLVPFHKLSQWLTYSLIEPLEQAGIAVRNVEGLTGLAEYRNGGLFYDTGVLRPRHARVEGDTHSPDSELVVEWRALTVALLDRVAHAIRDELGVDRERLPLAKLLEGGTWRAGRLVAQALRPGGPPPIRVASDGTLF